jgi:hypothetical protein
MKKSLLITSKILLIINIIYWGLIASYFSFFKFTSSDNYLIFKILLFLEPLFFIIALFGFINKIKTIYIFSIIFIFFNTLSSITDQVGFYDIISLILNILTLGCLLLAWKQTFNKTT